MVNNNYLKFLIMYKVIFSSLLLIIGCNIKSQKISNFEINDFITHFDVNKYNFTKNIFIHIRNFDKNEITYLVSKYNSINDGNFYITYDLKFSKISNSEDSLNVALEMSLGLSKKDLLQIIKLMNNDKLFLFGKDTSNNVFVNPFFINSPAYLFYKAIGPYPLMFNSNFNFKFYKERWYINERFLE